MLLWFTAQWRYERHSCVHKLFLNVWNEQNQSNQLLKGFCYVLPNSDLNKSAHPPLIYVCTHESLSNLSCDPHLLPLPPRPLRSLVLSPRSPRSLEDILAVEILLDFCPESRSFLSDHSHYFCHWVFGLFGHFVVIHTIYSVLLQPS